MPVTPAQQEYLRLIALLDEEIRSGRDDAEETPVSDGIREQLDALWCQMSAKEIDGVKAQIADTPEVEPK